MIIKKRWLDIRILLSRGLLYALLSACMLGLYIVLLETCGYFLHTITDIEILLIAGATTVLGTFFFRPIENYFQKITDPIFFRDKYDYAEAVHSISLVLQTNLNYEDILSRSEEGLCRIFKTNTVHFIFDQEMEADTLHAPEPAGNIEVTHKIMYGNRIVGIVTFGKKRSGEEYTKQDLQLISIFAFQVAIALRKAKLRDEVREYSTHLEQLVEERTLEIKKIQEEQQQTLIDISHNLQTPLAVIINELELLNDSTIAPEKLSRITKSIDRISGFIRQLLCLAELDHSLYPIELAPLDLCDLLKTQMEYFEVMAEEHGVQAVSTLASKATIMGNKRLLEELFTNLTANAIKYRSPDRKAIVKLTLTATKNEAIVSVSDNGIGIRTEDLKNIFKRFFRTSNQQQKDSGTGLGLAIAERIVQAHGGKIHVLSTHGEGTTFTLAFPLSPREN